VGFRGTPTIVRSPPVPRCRARWMRLGCGTSAIPSACGCCGKWIEHLEANGFDVDPVDVTDLPLVKSMAGIAPEQASCHTARVGDYVTEGHVPAGDIRRLLSEHPKARGVQVPGKPQGSPGMEAPNPQPYKVLLIGEDSSTSVFTEH